MGVWEQEGRLGEPRVSQEHIHPSNPFTQPASQPSPQAQSHKQFDVRYLKDGRFWTRTATQRARQPSSPAQLASPVVPSTASHPLGCQSCEVKRQSKTQPIAYKTRPPGTQKRALGKPGVPQERQTEAVLHPNPMESVSVAPFFKF